MLSWILCSLSVLMLIDAWLYSYLTFKALNKSGKRFWDTCPELFSKACFIPYSAFYLLYKYWKFCKESK